MYRTRAIITRSWFETALNYKPWILKLRKVSCNTYNVLDEKKESWNITRTEL